jgi:hypothetical protein
MLMNRPIISTAFAKALVRGLDFPALNNAFAEPNSTAERFILRGKPRTYSVAMEPLSGRRTRITILCQGAVIGWRTTRFPRCFAHVWSSDWGHAIASLRMKIWMLKGHAKLYDRVHLREPGALASLERGPVEFPAAFRKPERADREKDIANGVYGAAAEYTRSKIAIAEGMCQYFLFYQNAGREELFVKIWTQQRDYHPCVRTSWAKPVDIIELTVPSITGPSVSSAGPWQDPRRSRGHPQP